MAFFIYGTGRMPIGVEEITMKCASCEMDTPADVMVFSCYFHIFWLPFIPFGKEANIICTKCGLQRIKVPFKKDLTSNFEEIKSKFKHPIYVWSGLGLLSVMIIGAIINSVVRT